MRLRLEIQFIQNRCNRTQGKTLSVFSVKLIVLSSEYSIICHIYVSNILQSAYRTEESKKDFYFELHVGASFLRTVSNSKFSWLKAESWNNTQSERTEVTVTQIRASHCELR